MDYRKPRPIAFREPQILGFADKEQRDARFEQLRAQGNRKVQKFSDVDGRKSVWCIALP